MNHMSFILPLEIETKTKRELRCIFDYFGGHIQFVSSSDEVVCVINQSSQIRSGYINELELVS